MAFVDQFPVDLPSTSDPANFDPRADAYYGHLPTFVAQLNALAGILAQAAMPPLAIPYVFSTNTAVGDPGAGVVRLNNATQTSATNLLADLVSGIGQTVTGLLDEMGTGTSTVKGYVTLRAVADPTKWITWPATAVATPADYRNFTLQAAKGVGSGSSPFADGDLITLSFVPKGDKGDAVQLDVAPNFVGTEEGAFPSAGTPGRVTRLLNTTGRNTESWPFSANQITLPPGDYMVFASAPCSGVGANYLALRNVTDGSDIVQGPTTIASVVGGYNFPSQPLLPMMPFTLADAKTVRLEHNFANSGGSMSVSGNMIGAYIAIWKRN